MVFVPLVVPVENNAQGYETTAGGLRITKSAKAAGNVIHCIYLKAEDLVTSVKGYLDIYKSHGELNGYTFQMSLAFGICDVIIKKGKCLIPEYSAKKLLKSLSGEFLSQVIWDNDKLVLRHSKLTKSTEEDASTPMTKEWKANRDKAKRQNRSESIRLFKYSYCKKLDYNNCTWGDDKEGFAYPNIKVYCQTTEHVIKNVELGLQTLCDVVNALIDTYTWKTLEVRKNKYNLYDEKTELTDKGKRMMSVRASKGRLNHRGTTSDDLMFPKNIVIGKFKDGSFVELNKKGSNCDKKIARSQPKSIAPGRAFQAVIGAGEQVREDQANGGNDKFKKTAAYKRYMLARGKILGFLSDRSQREAYETIFSLEGSLLRDDDEEINTLWSVFVQSLKFAKWKQKTVINCPVLSERAYLLTLKKPCKGPYKQLQAYALKRPNCIQEPFVMALSMYAAAGSSIEEQRYLCESAVDRSEYCALALGPGKVGKTIPVHKGAALSNTPQGMKGCPGVLPAGNSDRIFHCAVNYIRINHDVVSLNRTGSSVEEITAALLDLNLVNYYRGVQGISTKVYDVQTDAEEEILVEKMPILNGIELTPAGCRLLRSFEHCKELAILQQNGAEYKTAYRTVLVDQLHVTLNPGQRLWCDV